MAEAAEGILSEDGVGLQQPAAVASELAGSEAAATPAAAPREEFVQNAVAFLSHPKVRDSSRASKEAFLERKGLNAAEIQEGFRRVPDSAASGMHFLRHTSGTSAGELRPSISPQSQVSQYASGPPPTQQPIRWTQVVVGVGIIAAGMYAVKQVVLPTASRYYQTWWQGSGTARRDTDTKPTEAFAAAIQAQTAELRAAVSSIQDVVQEFRVSRQADSEPAHSLAELRHELRTLATDFKEMATLGTRDQETIALKREVAEVKALVTALATSGSSRTPIGHKPDNSSAWQSPASSAMDDPGRQPNGTPTAENSANSWRHSPAPLAEDTPATARVVADDNDAGPPHPASYMEVLEMLEKGQTPPGIRGDIRDQPPNPQQPPPDSRLKPRPKPWERMQAPEGFGSPVHKAWEADSHRERQGEQAGTVTITELDEASSMNGAPAAENDGGEWRPPSAPQPTIPLYSKPASSSAASPAGSVTA